MFDTDGVKQYDLYQTFFDPILRLPLQCNLFRQFFLNSDDRGYFCLAGSNDPRPTGADWDYDEDGLILSNTTVCNTDVSCAGPCPPGHYCPDQGTLQPLPCPLNKYLNANRFIDPLNTFIGGATDESQCAGCPAGKWCQPGIAEPIDCPVGFYCEANSQPKPCPASTFRNEVGARNEGDCASCDAGFYCTNLGMTNQENFECKPGFYCPGGDNLPIKCPEGTYRNATGGKCGDIDDCRRQSSWRNRQGVRLDLEIVFQKICGHPEKGSTMKRTDVYHVQKGITVRSSPKEETLQMITDYRVRRGPIVPRVQHHDQSHVQLDTIAQRLHSLKSSHAIQEIIVLKVAQI